MMIIGLLAGIAVPRVSNSITHYRAEAAARRIVRDLGLAQARAKSSSAGQTVTFDVGADSYQLVGMQDINRSDEVYEVLLLGPPYRTAIVVADFDGDAEIVFDGYGVPDSGGIVVVEAGAHQKTIILDPDTGQASVQ